MNRTLASTIASAGLTTLLAAPAEAQLVFADTDRQTPFTYIDLATLRETIQFPLPANVVDTEVLPGTTGFNVWAMTADEANNRLLFLDVSSLFPGADTTSNLYSYDYDTGAVTFQGRVAVGGNDISVQGLALTDDGELYGIYNTGGVPGKGVYQIDLDNPTGSGFGTQFPSTLVVPTATQPGGDTAFSFGTLDYDPVTDKIYTVVDDNDAPQGAGIYEVDPVAGTFNFVVPSPDYRRLERDFDGLATGNGMAYLFTDEPGFVYAYDLVNGTGSIDDYTDFLSPIVEDSVLFAGSSFAPGLLSQFRLPGDANGDGMVDLADFGILRANFGSPSAFLTFNEADFNGDGVVDLADFGILRSNFGSSAAGDIALLDAWVATVPEPASAALVGLAGLAALRRRR
ncbi:MAG: dockerin type I domain-containing protein [Planctomycetota bacterium]